MYFPHACPTPPNKWLHHLLPLHDPERRTDGPIRGSARVGRPPLRRHLRVDSRDHARHLSPRRSGERQRVGEHRIKIGQRQAQPRIGRQAGEQVVAVRTLLANFQGNSDRVLAGSPHAPSRGRRRHGRRLSAPSSSQGTGGSDRVRGRSPPGTRRSRRARSWWSRAGRPGRRTHRAARRDAPPSTTRRPRSTGRPPVRRPSRRSQRRITVKPLMRSAERVFILCGIADEPTWPGRNPSVTSSCPAINLIVFANDDGAAATWTSALSTSIVERARIDLPDARQYLLEPEMGRDAVFEVVQLRRIRRADRPCPAPVPTGPLMPRSG